MVQFCYLRIYLDNETVSCRQLKQMARIDVDRNLKKSCLMLGQQNSPKYNYG